jgi:hypothetical protein
MADAKITLEEAEKLIKLSGLVFPPEIMEKMKGFIVKNWSTRDGKKTKQRLIYEIDHTCTKEYLGKLLQGDEAHLGWFQTIQRSYKDILEESEGANKNEMINSVNLQIEEISKIFTDGFFNVMKNNLVFNKEGEPISVRDNPGDRLRFQKCHEKLTEDDFARRAQKVAQRDPEGEGVTGKAFEKYGLGRKRKTKKRNNKKRKTLRYKNKRK